jgi:hypothetical protein
VSINDADQSAGPPVSEALALFREPSDAQRQAALTMMERPGDGQPISEAGLAFLTTCGMDAGDAEKAISALPEKYQGAD